MFMKPKTATPSSKSGATKSTSAKKPATKAAKPSSAVPASGKPSPKSKKPASTSARAKSLSTSKARSVAAKPAATEPTVATPEQLASPLAPSKQSQIITLLRGDSGASMPQLMTLTGWQSHTVRGMLSGSLRKRLGLNVQCQLEGGARVYRIVPEASGQ
jgi:hypothetical protein